MIQSISQMWRRGFAFALIAGVMSAHASTAPTAPPSLRLQSPDHACRNAVVRFVVSPEMQRRLRMRKTGEAAGELVLEGEGIRKRERLTCQLDQENGQTVATFVLPELAQNESRRYRLQWRPERRPGAEGEGVQVKREGSNVVITVGNSLFTRYGDQYGANKPYFYPILTPAGDHLTRRWPMETVAGESHDHPHHRGLWFTHGSVNGIDFWSEGLGTGKTLTTALDGLTSGPVYGRFHAATTWQAPDGKTIATDTRDITIYPLPNGDRLLDIAIAITPVDNPLVFGDTKEGSFGLRVADSLALTRREGGHIVTSAGNRDAAAWSKTADWVDYYGPLHGQTYGVALFDHPDNLRHPPPWHVRDYGLFAVNPFGRYDFHLGAKGSGDYTLPAGKSLMFRYHILFHKGDTASAFVSEQYAAYTDPPQVAVD